MQSTGYPAFYTKIMLLLFSSYRDAHSGGADHDPDQISEEKKRMRIRPLKKTRAVSDFENLEPGQEKFEVSDILGRNTNLTKTSGSPYPHHCYQQTITFAPRTFFYVRQGGAAR